MSRTGTGIKEDPVDKSTVVQLLRNVLPGAIVRVDGRWGVVCGSLRGTRRVVDFWEGGRETMPAVLVVEVLVDSTP